MKNNNFSFTKTARDTVEVTLPDGRIITGPRGATLEEFLSLLGEWEGIRIVGGVIDGVLRELSTTISKDSFVLPVNMSTSDGSKIYRRSLTFLLECAFQELYPQDFLTIDHSVPNGGYFCKAVNRKPLDESELKQLEEHMHLLVVQDLTIKKDRVALEEALEYFAQKQYEDKLNLLRYRKKPYLVLYQLKNHRDYHHGYMVPSTGYLKIFKLIKSGDGFILQYPRRKTPDQLLTMPRYSKLLDIFKQYGSWLESLNIDSVASLNDAIENDSIREVILVSEALHEQKIADVAERIKKKSNEIKIVLIAGPTSSGKTTFSKRLAIQLLTYGISPLPFEMDNYFVDRHLTPRDETGEYNFEAFEAIDTQLMEEHLSLILEGKSVEVPHFNFKTGKREKGKTIKIHENQILLIEGIHGLNPKLLADIQKEKKFRIYASCLTQLNLDHYNRISTTDSRLVRRIVRDARTRGFSAQRTIQLWESVRRGEREYIFPHQENADEIFNSAMVYELAALKPHVEPLLRQIPFGTPEHLEAKRLLAFLEWFLPVERELIPDNSILREFVGGSILSEFSLWNSSGKD